MQSTKTLKIHADLVDRMATATGTDLEEAILRGNLTIPDLDDAVLRCTGCTRPDACAHWLESQDGTDTTAPDYCRNASLFNALKHG